MRESYREVLASHSGLEPYADDGNIVGVASVRGNAGRRLSSEINISRADLVVSWGRQHWQSRYGRAVVGRGGVVEPVHAWTFQAREPGDPIGFHRATSTTRGPVERSENVTGGNADMNANRKSDGPIVPAKRTNKTGTLAAESVEERGSPKGNAASSVLAADTVPISARQHYARLRQVEMRKIILTVALKGGAV